MSVKRFQINNVNVGIMDENDVIQGKEAEFIRICTELWNYIHFEFHNSKTAEDDYMSMCSHYEDDVKECYKLNIMDDLNVYCEQCGIGVNDFLERMDPRFSIYNEYFVNGDKFVSGDSLRDFKIDYSYILKAIISSPIDICGHDIDVKDPELVDMFTRMKECVKKTFYWVEK